MVDLPELPERVARLPKDHRGFPVPWFVEWLKDGKPAPAGWPGAEPDFRVIGHEKLNQAWRMSRCWICGDKLGVHQVYAIGPMCVVNRVTSEPASHRDCAEFAAKACPFLTKPRMRRNTVDLPEGGISRGLHIDRNPGCVALYETPQAKPFKVTGGYLFKLGPPTRVDWWAEGRRATRAEVEASINSGYPILLDTATKYDGPAGVAELQKMRVEAERLLPA